MATIPEQRQHAAVDSNGRGERSLASLLKELRDETTTLLREEVTLAKTEMSEKVSRISRNAGYLAGGGLVAFAGLLILLMAASAGLHVGMLAMDVDSAISLWLSPLIVAVVTIVIGYTMLQKAINTLKHESAVPERTVRTVRDDTNWIKEKVAQ